MELIGRISRILLAPRSEWAVIAREPSDPVQVLRGYVLILAAIPAVAGFVGTSLIGVPVPTAGVVRVPIVTGLINAALSYAVGLAVIYGGAQLATLLAPKFGGHADFTQAFKLMAYAWTPGWLAGVFIAMPPLAFLSLFGLYALVLLWLGVEPLMKVPQERRAGYTTLLILGTLVIAVMLALLQVGLTGIG
jgi:hypothetical protein